MLLHEPIWPNGILKTFKTSMYFKPVIKNRIETVCELEGGEGGFKTSCQMFSTEKSVCSDCFLLNGRSV